MIRRSTCLLLSLLMASVFVTNVLAADLAEPARNSLHVNADGSGDYPGLQAAIDAAKPGDVIQLGPGFYETSVIITKPVTLRGAGWEKTRIKGRYFHPYDLEAAPEDIRDKMAEYHRRASAADGYAYEEITREMAEKLGPKVTFTIRSTRNVVVKDLSISLPGPVQKGGLMSLPAVLVVDALAKFNGVAVIDSSGDGARLTAGAEAEFDRCLFASIRGTGLEIREARDDNFSAHQAAKRGNVGPVKVRDCDFRTFGYSGILIGKGTTDVSIKRCRISRACYHGIYYRDSKPTIADCWIFDNRRSGIYVRDATAATVENNVFLRNGFSAHEQTRDLIERNTFYAGGTLEPDVFAGGVNLRRGSQAKLKRNLILNNRVGVALAIPTKGDANREETGHGSPSLGELDLTGSLFWENEQTFVMRRYRNKQLEIQKLQLPGGNQEARPGLVDPENDNFTPAEDSLAEKMNAGARPVIELKSPWPVQPEEAKLLEALGETFLSSRPRESK